MPLLKEGEGFVVAAPLQEVPEPRMDAGWKLRLESGDFFRGGLEPFEMRRRVLLPCRVVGDDGESFAQGSGEGEIGVCVLHRHKLAHGRREVTGGFAY